MQKTKLTLPQALRRLKKADDSVRDGDRRRRRAARLRAADQELRSRPRRLPLRRASISTSGCSCRNDPGNSGVIGPRSSRSTTAAFARSRRQQDDPARLQNRRQSPSTAPRPAPAPDLRRRGPRCRRESRASSVTRCVRASQRRRRLVEPDVTVRAEAEDLEVDAAGGGDLALVARALLRR